MLYSPTFKSSTHCLPSPDGRLIATLFASVVNVRAVQSLRVVNVVKLSTALTGAVSAFQWSPTSNLLLIAQGEQVHVVDALGGTFHADIRNPVSTAATISFASFGPSDKELCVFSSLGLKFVVFNLESGKAVEVANPKFWSALGAPKGFSFRPRSGHLALLTRTAGRDMISIHDPATREVQRSWHPDTIDSQGLRWSPDGRWLVTWESAAQGHKILFYTPDGYIYKAWSRLGEASPGCKDLALGSGVRLVCFSADATQLAIGDSSRSACILSLPAVTDSFRLDHPLVIEPKDTLQVWQEQVTTSQTGISVHAFVRANQTIYPPARPTREDSSAKAGCSSILFDPSSALVATQLDDSPGTVWIWDLQAAELRAILLFHGSVKNMSWHPKIAELLLVGCEGEQYDGVLFAWDPLSEGPRSIEYLRSVPETGKRLARAAWLNLDPPLPPTIFISSTKDYVLACLDETDENGPPWQTLQSENTEDAAIRSESPLELIPATETEIDGVDEEEGEDDSTVDDTFFFKRATP